MTFLRFAMLIYLVSGSVFAAEAQQILLLEKIKKPKRIKHYVGDQLAFRFDDEKYTISGTIEMIREDGIVVEGEFYKLNQITMVLNYQKYAAFRVLSKSAFIAIPPMLVMTMLHRGLNTGEQPLVDRNSLQVMGVFAGIGAILWPFKARKYRLEKKWQLRVIDITPG